MKEFRVLIVSLIMVGIGSMGWGAISETPVEDLLKANGAINAIAQEGNTIYLGGGFTRVGVTLTGSGVPLDVTTGTPGTVFPKVEGGDVLKSVPDGSGGWYICGRFTKVGGQKRIGLARILADGTVGSWDPNKNGNIYNINFYTLAIGEKNVFVGGKFSSIGLDSQSAPAAVDKNTGELDKSWIPTLSGDKTVSSLAVSGGKVYLGGSFSTVNGADRKFLAAVSEKDGTLDSWQPSPNSSINTIVINEGKVYVGGYFTKVGTETRTYLAAFDEKTGGLDSWNPIADSIVYTLTVSGGKLYVGGSFFNIGGKAKRALAKFDVKTGILDDWPAIAPNSYVASLTVIGEKVYVGGQFTAMGGTTRNYLAAISATTGNLDSWNPNVDGDVYSVSLSGGKVYAGGSFISMGGTTRNRLAAINATTGELGSWDPNANGSVRTLAVSDGQLFVGGDFEYIGGVVQSALAKFNAKTGVLDSAWNPGVPRQLTTPFVKTIAVSEGKVYVGGIFYQVGTEKRNSLAAIDAATGIVDSWNPNLNAGGSIDVLTVSGVRVYVAGYFNSLGGKSCSYLGAVDTTKGDLDTSWNPKVVGYGGYVGALTVSGAKVYVGGSFGSIDGIYSSRYLAAVSTTTGVLDNSWSPTPDGYVNTLTLSGGKVYVGGEFTSIGGTTRNRLAAFTAATGALDSWNPNADGTVNVIADGDGQISVGGNFWSMGTGSGPAFFARFTLPPPAAPVSGGADSVTSSSVTGQWSPSEGASGYTFATSINSINPPSPVAGSLTATTNSATVIGLTPNTTYYMFANARNKWGSSTYTSLGSTFTLAAVPTLSPGTVGTTTTQLTIGANGNPVGTTYVIEKSIDGGEIYTKAMTTTELTPTVTGLTAGTNYKFQVMARNLGGVLTASSLDVGVLTAPSAPVSGSVSNVTDSGVKGHWLVSDGASTYTLAASTNSINPPTPDAESVSVSTNSGTVSGLSLNTAYYLFVNACNTGGCSNYTALGSTATLAAVPTLSPGTVGTTTTQLTIGANGNPVGTTYVIEKSIDGGEIYTKAMTTTELTPTVTGLTAGTNYKFRVMARNLGGVLTASSLDVGVLTAPSAPVSGSVSNVTDSGVKGQWLVSDGASTYTLAASTNSINPPTPVAGSDSVELDNGTLTGLLANKRYFLFVNACNTGGCSNYTAMGSTVTLAAVPTLSPGTVGTTTVQLTIKANGNPVGTTYVIEQSEDGGAGYTRAMTTTELTPTVTGLRAGTNYKFQVMARNLGGVLTTPSASVGALTAPVAPGSGSVKATTFNSVGAQWAVSDGASGYTFAASTNSANPPAPVSGSVSVEMDNGTVVGLLANKTYFLFVKACNSGGCSDYMSFGSTITLAAVPSVSLETVGTTSVQLKITDNGNPLGTTYVIEKSVDGGATYTGAMTTTELTPTVTGLRAGTNYKFQVMARNLGGVLTPPSGDIGALLAPSAPLTGNVNGVGSQSIGAQWGVSVGASGYTLAASLNSNNPPTPVAGSVTAATSSGTLSGLSPNTAYFMFVNACNSGGCSDYLSLGSTLTLSAVPTVVAKAEGGTSVRLTITANMNPAGTVYAVEESSGSNANYARISMGTNMTVTVTGLIPGTPYRFRVVSINSAGVESAPSAVASATPGDFSTQTVRAYPVPFRPGHGVDHMTFDQLPAGATIKVYSMTGQLVKSLTATDTSLTWDVRNDGGESVSSGVYVVQVEGAGGSKMFKIVVQR